MSDMGDEDALELARLDTRRSKLEQCKHEILKASCSICSGRDKRELEQEKLETKNLLSLKNWFRALYPGQCRECGEYFAAGTPITLLDIVKGKNFYRAKCCATTTELEGQP